MDKEGGTLLSEVDIDDWTGGGGSEATGSDGERREKEPSFDEAKDILSRMTLLRAAEWPSTTEMAATSPPRLILLVRHRSNHAVVVAEEVGGALKVVHSYKLGSGSDGEKGDIVSSTPIEICSVDATTGGEDDAGTYGNECLRFGCVWSSGMGSVVNLRFGKGGDGGSGGLCWATMETFFESSSVEHMETDACVTDDDDEELRRFYENNKIVAMDVFVLRGGAFPTPFDSVTNIIDDKDEVMVDATKSEATTSKEGGTVANGASYPYTAFDADDFELYGDEVADAVVDSQPFIGGPAASGAGVAMPASRLNTLGAPSLCGPANCGNGVVRAYIAVCRQSGLLQIFDAAKLGKSSSLSSESDNLTGERSALVWEGYGCGLGTPALRHGGARPPPPKMHATCAVELRFFFCGPASLPIELGVKAGVPPPSMLRSLCLLVVTNLGDAHLYAATERCGGPPGFERVSLRLSARPSKEETRHNSKLLRKRMLPKVVHKEPYRHDCLHRFMGLSGQDGLFVALSRPMWIVSERGAPSALCHRMRHAAPAGGRDVLGFCSGLGLTVNSCVVCPFALALR